LPGMYWLNLIANGQTLGTKLYIYWHRNVIQLFTGWT
jgi:hypothetical protein